MQTRTTGYDRRLREALEEGPRPMSIRQLGQEMEERHPEMRGATYGGVRQYAAGNIQNPRVELLRAIAHVLEIRPDWLAFDDGPMTEEEDGVAETTLRAIEEADGDAGWKRALEMKFGVLEGLGFEVPDLTPITVPGGDPWAKFRAQLRSMGRGHIPHWVPPLFELARRLGLGVTDAKKLGAALHGPLVALGIEPRSMRQDDFNDYITGMIPVLLALAPERERQNEEEETSDG